MLRNEMQNSETTELWGYTGKKNDIPVYARVITTNKRLIAYIGSKIVGEAGVKHAKDFDYESLLRFAKASPDAKAVL